MGPEHLVNIIPNTWVDDYFFWGFTSGLVAYAYYRFTNQHDPNNHLNPAAACYGVFLSGCVGGLLAIVFDKAISLSILVGLLNQTIYLAFLKSAKHGKFIPVLKDILIKYLTAGKS